MGRWGSDVVALMCIAGGMVVATGMTAAWAARSNHDARVVCVAEVSPSVVVSIGSSGGDAQARTTHTIRSVGADACASAVEIDMAGIEARVERARARAEAARGRAEVARVRVEAARRDVERARVRVERIDVDRIQADVARARLEAAEQRIEAAARQLEGRIGAGELEAALDAVRAALETELERALVTEIVVPAAPGTPAAPAAPAAPAPRSGGND